MNNSTIHLLILLICLATYPTQNIILKNKQAIVQAMILVMQTRCVPQAAGLEFLRLLSTTTPTEAPGKSQGELIIEFGNTFWLMLFGLFLVLSGL